MRNIHKIRKNVLGISLLEVIVATSIFALILLAAMGIFEKVLQAQQNTIASQNIQESLRYSLEMMSKELRSAQRATSTNPCGTTYLPVDQLYHFDNPGTGKLYFINKYGLCSAYYLLNGRLMVDRGASNSAAITASNVIISNLNFIVNNGTNMPGDDQARITLSFSVAAKGKKENKNFTTIQTTISSRYYD